MNMLTEARSLAEELERTPCVIHFEVIDGELSPFDVMLWGGRSIVCEFSKKIGQLLTDRWSGGSIGKHGNTVRLHKTRGLEPDPIWIAEGLTVCDINGNPCSAESLGYRVVPDMGDALTKLDNGRECNSIVHCAVCRDWFPDESDLVCEHIWWCDESGDWVGPGVPDSAKPCEPSAGCFDCDRHRHEDRQ